ncbi:hypothetical protein C0J52_26067 [Blattella germanica]|nr:hypothetical protein C0J52_26067 [Blattella germanica]
MNTFADYGDTYIFKQITDFSMKNIDKTVQVQKLSVEKHKVNIQVHYSLKVLTFFNETWNS